MGSIFSCICGNPEVVRVSNGVKIGYLCLKCGREDEMESPFARVIDEQRQAEKIIRG